MLEELCPRFMPAGQVLYVNDPESVDFVADAEAFAALGITIDERDKLPDLVVHMADRNWLVLASDATTTGPVDAARRGELAKL